MLILRTTSTSAPVDAECAYCSRLLPANQEFYVIETFPQHKKTIEEFSLACPRCYTDVKDAAIRHKIPIEFDLDLDGTRAGVGLKERED
jgi:hypothetical protein